MKVSLLCRSALGIPRISVNMISIVSFSLVEFECQAVLDSAAYSLSLLLCDMLQAYLAAEGLKALLQCDPTSSNWSTRHWQHYLT
ncbi:hypothetical protein FKM82_021555 [Ascaphus truei]